MVVAEGMPLVVHVSPRVQARGGIETLHTYHREMPLRQQFIALFDRSPPPTAGYANLNAGWSTPLQVMRQRFSRVMAAMPGSVVAYHNAWGLPLFHDLDRASRRVVMMHADPAYHAPDLPGLRGLIDGAMAITPALHAELARSFPELDEHRTAHYRVPIESPPAVLPTRAAVAGRPVVLGYAGRIEQAQKRLDRLPGFMSALRATGLDFRFEIVGAGAYRKDLERMPGGQARFHGWVSRGEYWRILAGWDAMVFFSDHEGGPIALLEGMAVGAIPFYPARGGSWADEYLPEVNPAGYYAPGEIGALANAFADVFRRPEAELAAMRKKAQMLVASHRGDSYKSDCMNFLQQTASSPRVSQQRSRARFATDWLPLGLASRLAPETLRRG